MSFIFNNTIPAAANSPTIDQPIMLTNNVSAEAIMNVDHIGYNASNGGTHLQMHMGQYTNPTVINGTATQGSVVYSAAGVADIAHAQLKFKQPNGTFLLSGIRAYGVIDGLTGNISSSQSFNISSSVRNSIGNYTITLDANVTTGTTFGVLLTSTPTASSLNIPIGLYNIIGVSVINILYSTSLLIKIDPFFFTIIVYQI